MEEREIDDVTDLLTAIYIQQSRMYDILVRMLMLQDQDVALSMVEAHAKGELYGPPPALVGENEQPSE